MNGININQILSKKTGIAVTGIVALVYVEAGPEYIMYLAIVAVVVQGVLDLFKPKESLSKKGEQNEKSNDSGVPAGN